MGKDKNNKNNKMGVISLVISLVIVVMFVTILVAQTINKNDNTGDTIMIVYKQNRKKGI